MFPPSTPEQLQWVVEHNQQVRGGHRVQILMAVEAWRAVIRERDALVAAAKATLAQFDAITRHQHELLMHGQTLESAEANWDEATLGQSIDFQLLIDAVALVEPPPSGGRGRYSRWNLHRMTTRERGFSS